jgi:hypothetical protein
MSILSDEIDNDPTGKGYGALLPDNPGAVVELLNARTETMFKTPTMVTNRTILELPIALSRSILTKFRAFATQDIVVEQAVLFLADPSGIDCGHPNTHEMLDQLALVPAPNGFTAEEVTALKNLALKPASRAEVLGLPYMTEEQLGNR